MCIQYKYEDLFPEVEGKTNGTYVKRRAYDVKITINNSGNDRNSLRFGLCNLGKEVFEKYGYVRISDYPVGRNRHIYFELENEKKNRKFYKISKSVRRDGIINNCYFSFTPPAEYEKGYRMNWVGGEYMLKYDESLGLYYIEKTNTSSTGGE